MFSVHYKFKATLEYKTLTFDGLHIGVDELKKAICDKENIRTESFDLLLTNAHTKREYAVGELVPRNSSVVVQRIPRENALKLPKVQDTSTSGIISRNVSSSLFQQNSYIKPEEFAGMTEEQRLAHIKRVSTEKYNSSNYQRRTGGIMTGPPPATYVCNRCGQPGHWYKSCPLLNVRRTAGITMDELMETHRDDPLAMIHPSGKFVKPIMHHQARMQRKYEPFPGQPDESRSPGQSATTTAVPEQFRCRLCGGILRDAVLSACCGHSFCAECYQQQLLTHPTQLCPGADCVQQISADSLVPNKMLRDAVQKYLILGIGALEPATTMTASVGGTITTAAMTAQAGANKPNVLTDTHSLLHKLLPGLAAAQAQRELDTTATPSTVTTTALSSAPPVSGTTASVADELAAATSMQTTTAGTQGSGAFSAHPQQQIGVPPSSSGCATSSAPGGGNAVPLAMLFDPNKPPPSLTASMLASVAGGAATTDPTSRMHAGGGAGISSLYSAPHSQSGNAQPMFTGNAANSMVPTSTALSAEDSLSVWESFLKRKENEKAERNLQLMRNSGSNIYQLQQQQRAAANMLFEGGREQSTAYGRDRDRGSDRDHRDHHHYHHRNSGSNRGGGGGATTDKDEEGGGGRHSKPSKMTVDEMSSVWKLFEKHSNEKKEEGDAKEKERAEGDKKKEEEKEGREEKNESAWREERRTKEKGKKEGKEEWSEKSEEKRKVDKRKEGKDGWREEQDRSEEKKPEKEERKREEGREEKGAKATKREEKRKDGKKEWRGEKEEKEKSEESRKVEKDEGKDGWKEEKSKESSKREKGEGKREEGREVKEEGGSTREEKRKEGKTEWREEKEKSEERRKTEKGDGKREEVKEERPKREDKKKEGRDERRGEKEKSEETRKRERTERNDQSGKEEKGEKARREETSRERKEERGAKDKRKEGKDEWIEVGREVKEKPEEKKKTEKDVGKKEEGREEKGERSRRDEKRKEGRDDWRGERKKERRTTAEEEKGDKDKRLFVSPPAAVNQLDITLAQEEAAGWRSGRLRHAPPQSPPNFEDTSRWRPIPEVQVRTESPANAGDELFINMADKRRAERKDSVEAVVKEAAEFSTSSSRRRSESQSHDQKNGKGDAEEKEKKKSGKRERSHKRRHQSGGGTGTEATEDDERGGGGGKRRRKHKKEKKSKRKRKEKKE